LGKSGVANYLRLLCPKRKKSGLGFFFANKKRGLGPRFLPLSAYLFLKKSNRLISRFAD
jgi:hypothetical protein